MHPSIGYRNPTHSAGFAQPRDAAIMSHNDLRLERYPFTVRPLTEDEGAGYLIEFPDVPGCMSDGATPEEAITNGRDALKSALLTMMEFGDTIPEPGTVRLLSARVVLVGGGVP
jgi:predicted RNase H-like HicB family nuclease